MSMKYELKNMEMIIENFIRFMTQQSDNTEPLNKQLTLQQIKSEATIVRQAFIDTVFSLKKDKQIERYIQQHQHSLIRLSDRLMKKVRPIEFKKIENAFRLKDAQEVNYRLYVVLEELLSFIESYFSKYFNQDEHIPTKYRVIAQCDFKRKVLEIESWPSCKLKTIATDPLKNFLTNNRPVTFRYLIFLKELEKEIRHQCQKCNKPCTSCNLNRGLVYLNYNNFEFINFGIQQITKDYQEAEDITGQIERLSLQLKKINQIHTKPNIAYKDNYTSAKDQLTEWVIEELAHLEKIYQLKLKFPEQTLEEINAQFKITTDLSVSQVAFFVRLLVDTGLILNKNHTEIISFFAKNISTKKAANISQESFRSKYYRVDESTREFIRQKVIEMLNQANKIA